MKKIVLGIVFGLGVFTFSPNQAMANYDIRNATPETFHCPNGSWTVVCVGHPWTGCSANTDCSDGNT
ncbi:hypothetical protein JYB64_17720 [Algoriphagus aestuarii]|nr:hypothetical protein [Algoriphagus aestuarii]